MPRKKVDYQKDFENYPKYYPLECEGKWYVFNRQSRWDISLCEITQAKNLQETEKRARELAECLNENSFPAL